MSLLVSRYLLCVLVSRTYSTPQGSGSMITIMGGGGKKKFSLYLRLFLDKKKKRNGLCNQMLETVIGFFAIVQRVCPKHLGLLGAAERRCRQHF